MFPLPLLPHFPINPRPSLHSSTPRLSLPPQISRASCPTTPVPTPPKRWPVFPPEIPSPHRFHSGSPSIPAHPTPDPGPPYLLLLDLRPRGPGPLLQSLPPGRRSPARGQELRQLGRPLSPILPAGGRHGRRRRSVAAAAPLHIRGWAPRASAPRQSRPRTTPGRSAAAPTTARSHHGPAGARGHRPQLAAPLRLLGPLFGAPHGEGSIAAASFSPTRHAF